MSSGRQIGLIDAIDLLSAQVVDPDSDRRFSCQIKADGSAGIKGIGPNLQALRLLHEVVRAHCSAKEQVINDEFDHLLVSATAIFDIGKAEEAADGADITGG